MDDFKLNGEDTNLEGDFDMDEFLKEFADYDENSTSGDILAIDGDESEEPFIVDDNFLDIESSTVTDSNMEVTLDEDLSDFLKQSQEAMPSSESEEIEATGIESDEPTETTVVSLKKEQSEIDETPVENVEDSETSEQDEIADILSMIPDVDIPTVKDSSDETPDVSKPTDIGDLLQDTLGVVSSLEDPEMAELEEKVNALPTKPDKKEKVSIWKRFFANIVNDEIIEKENQDRIDEEEKSKQKAAMKEEQSKKKKEKKAAKSEADQKKKAEKLEAKKKKQAEKAKLKEERAKQDAMIPQGKINRVGASIVASVAIIVGILVIFGTKSYTYGLGVDKATDFYERRLYSIAYDEIAGLDVGDRDEELYEKLNTIMVVNRQYESYENYMNLKKKEKALDALIKGLEKYSTFYDKAVEYGITKDMDYVKSEIIKALQETFHLTEKEANKLSKVEDASTYTKQIKEVVKNSSK